MLSALVIIRVFNVFCVVTLSKRLNSNGRAIFELRSHGVQCMSLLVYMYWFIQDWIPIISGKLGLNCWCPVSYRGQVSTNHDINYMIITYNWINFWGCIANTHWFQRRYILWNKNASCYLLRCETPLTLLFLTLFVCEKIRYLCAYLLYIQTVSFG